MVVFSRACALVGLIVGCLLFLFSTPPHPQEITSLIEILGLKFNTEYTSTKSLRYGHVMVMADQDHDGSHIKGLVINFLHAYWPSLFRIPGFLCEFITPIVKCTKVGARWLVPLRAYMWACRSLVSVAFLAALRCVVCCPRGLAFRVPVVLCAGLKGNLLLHHARVRGVAEGPCQRQRLDH